MLDPLALEGGSLGACDGSGKPQAAASADFLAIWRLIFCILAESSSSFALARKASSPPRLSTERSAAAETRAANDWPSASECTVTLTRFGSKRRLVLMFEWLTLWPTSGFLPVSSHVRDMARLLTSGCEKRPIRWLLTGRTSEGGWIRVGLPAVKQSPGGFASPGPVSLHRPALAGISPLFGGLSLHPRAARDSRLMPVLTAVIAAGGFLTLPLAGNGAIQAIMVQPMHL